MTEHTPGPWHLDGSQIKNADGDALASWPHSLGDAEDHANARLMAAAPGLLAAVEAAYETMRGLGPNAPTKGPKWEAFLLLRAAIFKATIGDEPDGAGRDHDLGAVDYRETLERGYPEAGR